MKILEPLKKGERIIILSTLLFTFFLFLYFYKGEKTPAENIINSENISENRDGTILEECRAYNSSIQKIRCVNKNISFQEDWTCMNYYTAHSKLYNSINNLHILPVTIECGYKSHRVGVVYSCEPNNQSLTTYFCLQNNWDLEWCGEW